VWTRQHSFALQDATVVAIFARTHFGKVPLPMIKDEVHDVIPVLFFGLTAEMPNANSFAYPLEEFWSLLKILVKKNLFLMIQFEYFGNLKNLEVFDL
jgi:hypothetical protein